MDVTPGAEPAGPAAPGPASEGARPSPQPGTLPRRALGALLVACSLLPLHLLLDPAETGPAGIATRGIGQSFLPFVWSATVFLALVSAVLARSTLGIPLLSGLSRAGALLARPALAGYTIALSTLALLLGIAISLFVFRGYPTLLDEMSQLLHARYLTAGQLAGHLPDPAAARLVQNDLITTRGWVSVYPPLHTLLLALGLLLEAPWVIGPALLATTVGFTTLTAAHLFPDRPATARLGALLAALSPFLLFLGSGYLSHVSAAAGAAAAAYLGLRARDGSPRWALGAGGAAAAMFASRPWMGLVLGGFFTAGVWAWAASRRSAGPVWRSRWLGARLAWASAAALPIGLALAWYNLRLFGSPVRFGYDLAFGPAHGLGWHSDPWGNAYGLVEAVGYTGFDLLMLGVHLLESPVPAVALVGAFLILPEKLPRGTGFLLGWALLPVAANALYWHHGYHMGPRMLYEAAPAWALLTALAVVELARPAVPPAAAAAGRGAFRPAFFGWLAVLALPVGLVYQVPSRVDGYRWPETTLRDLRLPDLPAGRRALVFVHGGWEGRVAARLAGDGMRRDSVETALRRNDLCVLHLYTDARTAEARAPLPALDLDPFPGSPPNLRMVQLSPGNLVRIDPGRPIHPDCARQARSDRMGVLELAPLLWQSPLPDEDGALLLARDLGPALNRLLMGGFPDREAFFYVPVDPGQGPVLIPYGDGEVQLWGTGGGIPPAGPPAPGKETAEGEGPPRP